MGIGMVVLRRCWQIPALIAVVTILMYPFHVMNGHPVRIESLDSITTSSTQSEVEKLLGRPSYITTEGNKVLWQYSDSTCVHGDNSFRGRR